MTLNSIIASIIGAISTFNPYNFDNEPVEPHIKEASNLSKELISYGKEEGLHLSGYGGALAKEVNCISFYYSEEGFPDITQARDLFVNIHNHFSKKIKEHQSIQQYLSLEPFYKDHLEVCVGFKDPVSLKFPDTWIASVTEKNGEILYFSQDERYSPCLVCLHKETWEEALEKYSPMSISDAVKALPSSSSPSPYSEMVSSLAKEKQKEKAQRLEKARNRAHSPTQN